MFELTVRGKEEKVSLAALPALRQAFGVGAVFIILGVWLGVTEHAYFFALPLLVSFGLTLSAVFGVCPMAAIMEKMPWNK
jgi:hypothetical protein